MSILIAYEILYSSMVSYLKISTTLMRLGLQWASVQWASVQRQRLLQVVINIVVHIFYSLGIANGLQQLNQLMQWDGLYLYTLSLKQRPISKRAGLILS
jgi:hypothetical protein